MADLGFIVPPPVAPFTDPAAGLAAATDPYAITGGVDPTAGVAAPGVPVPNPLDQVAAVPPSPLEIVADAYVVD